MSFNPFAGSGSGIDASQIPSYTISEISDGNYQLIKETENGELHVGDIINIPKDMVVQSGSVKTCILDNSPVVGYVTGDKYIDLVLANSNNSHVYVLVKDLVDKPAATQILVNNSNFTVIEGTTVQQVLESINNSFVNLNDKVDDINENLQTAINNIALHGSTTEYGSISTSEKAIKLKSAVGARKNNELGEVFNNYDLNSAKASGSCAAGIGCTVGEKGEATRVIGYACSSNAKHQVVFGTYNVPDEGAEDNYKSENVVVIGNGINSDNRHNALEVKWSGDVKLQGSVIPTLLSSTIDLNNVGAEDKRYISTEDISGILTVPENLKGQFILDVTKCNDYRLQVLTEIATYNKYHRIFNGSSWTPWIQDGGFEAYQAAVPYLDTTNIDGTKSTIMKTVTKEQVRLDFKISPDIVTTEHNAMYGTLDDSDIVIPEDTHVLGYYYNSLGMLEGVFDGALYKTGRFYFQLPFKFSDPNNAPAFQPTNTYVLDVTYFKK